MRGFGRKGEQDVRGTHGGHEYEQGGLALGYDRFIGRYTIGASLGFVNNRLDATGVPGRSRVDSTLYSLYGGYADQRRFLDALVSYGRNDYHLAREIVIGEFDTGVTGSSQGQARSVGFSGGTFHEAHGWSFGPTATLQYIRLGEPGFLEQGGPLALDIQSRTTHTLAGSLGARVGRSLRVGNGEWVPELSVALRHDRALGDRTIDASFAGAPDTTFAISERAVPRDGVLTGLGATYRSGGFAARLSWSGEFRGGAAAHGLFAGIRYML
jgi:outer membrane autotransporter protein